VAWKNVWLGAALTSFLFGIGKWLFGLYLGHSAIGSSYGAAGSLVIVVLWTYYSSLILLFGAEVTQVASTLHGEPITPAEKAVHVTEHARVQQGMPHNADWEASATFKEREPDGVSRIVSYRDSRPIGSPSKNRTSGLIWFALGWILSSLRHRIDQHPRPKIRSASGARMSQLAGKEMKRTGTIWRITGSLKRQRDRFLGRGTTRD
jgi:hypothetical protein